MIINLLVCSLIIIFFFIISIMGLYHINGKKINCVYIFGITPLVSILILWCLLIIQILVLKA
ncbi:hypothetical protein [Campylobacter phage vB_CcoM-IBB_35]|uniref:Uncharacterized protein n=1 Tax=Campylobacter virus IBB35 TaxID=1006972 RepID=H6SUM2_9CAUD|nr:hypothetical protein FDG52_s5gp02 [Campylobacter phage vB_CcoM-IBB_35]AEI88239.1 hypothetical protein [Campylobacter phage vB_CcoM-IBB_35]